MKKFSLLIIFFLTLRGHIINVDGDPSDWVAHGVTKRDTFFYIEHPGYIYDKIEAVWVDQINDDLGDGDYSYPTDVDPGTGLPRFKGKEADLLELRFTEGATSLDTFLYFLIIVGDTFGGNGDWPSFIAYFTIDTLATLQNSKYAPQYSDVKILGEWQFSGVFSMYHVRLLDHNYSDINTGHHFARMNNVYEAALKIDSLKLYHNDYWISFGIGLEDFGMFREVDSIAGQYVGGGGITNWADPDLYDLAFIKSSAQAAELSNYSPNNPVTLVNPIKKTRLYVDVKEKIKLVIKDKEIEGKFYDATGRKNLKMNKKGVYIKPSVKKVIKLD
ncbi:MAG: glucodextranase DOMON-like domain-containing protein [Candidatus Hydrothermales bacterium]